MKNNSLKEISKIILNSNRVLILTHINGDGDTLGSAAALCLALRENGAEAWILVEDKVPDNLEFLVAGIYTDKNPFDKHFIAVAVDCSDKERFPERQSVFFEAEATINIDHHMTNDYFADYNYVEKDSAATAELVYLLINEMGISMPKSSGEAIFAAINTDTGLYQNLNTTARSHRISAELYDMGIDHNKVSVELFQSVKPEKLKLENMVISTMESFYGGKGVVAYCTLEMLEKTGTLKEDTEGIVALLRNIKGVDISVFIREQAPGENKISMRVKGDGDVARIARMFGGGGHIKAAGCTIKGTPEEAKKEILIEVEKELDRLYG